MRSFKTILFLILLFSTNCFSQNQGINNNWLQGYSSSAGLPFGQTRLDFFTGAPTITYDSIEMDFRHTHANISDTGGNILFYTNGYYIADASNDTMQNGSNINPGAFANYAFEGFTIPQGAIIIPKPGNDSLYYMFHSSYDNYPTSSPYFAAHLYLTTINKYLNNGLGSVVLKNQQIINDSLNVGKITACKHANGRDWWIVVHKLNSNVYYKLLITPSVILGPYTQSIGSIRSSDVGQATFSPNGTKYAYYYVNDGLDIFDFNRCTGLFSNPEHIGILNEGLTNIGMAISPSSNALYISNVQHIYQFDLTASNISSTNLTVATYDSFLSVFPGFPGLNTYFGLSALAPDGKIYITTGNGTVHMHTIDNPDVIGLGCNVNQHSIQLPTISYNTLPNHPNYFLACDTTLGCLCAITTNTNEIASQQIPIKVSPNPTTGNFTLQFNTQPTTGIVQLYNINSKLVLQQNIAPFSQYKHLNITNLPQGIYLCKLKWGNVEVNVKVIKE